MHPPGADTVVVRYGDASIKSGRVRKRMERQLIENLGALLEDREIPGEVERRWARPLIRTDEEHIEAATEAAADAFGVTTVSSARSVEPEFEAILDVIGEIAPTVYEGGTFAINARRAGDLPFSSTDLGKEGGAAVFEAVDFEPEVDLDDPDVTFFVEARQKEAFVFLEKRSGPGGLPLGSQEPLVALVSGGIDSPVAAFRTMKRGSPIIPVYLDLGPYGGPDHRARAMETVRTLARFAPNFDMRTWVVPVGEAAELLMEEMERGRMLSYRRFMYAVAEAVAESTGAAGIVTGEALGQKSSQTAANFAVVSRATKLPVHRPLLSLDKHEITEEAKAIGTYDDSTIPAGCYRIAPDQVETAASIEKLLEMEPEGLLEMAEHAVEKAELVDPRALAEVPAE